MTRALDKTWMTAKDCSSLRGDVLCCIDEVGRPASSVLSFTVTLIRKLESKEFFRGNALSVKVTSVNAVIASEKDGDTGRSSCDGPALSIQDPSPSRAAKKRSQLNTLCLEPLTTMLPACFSAFFVHLAFHFLRHELSELDDLLEGFRTVFQSRRRYSQDNGIDVNFNFIEMSGSIMQQRSKKHGGRSALCPAVLVRLRFSFARVYENTILGLDVVAAYLQRRV